MKTRTSRGTAAPRLLLLLLAMFSLLLAAGAARADNCSAWSSPQKVWFNEYFFGVGGSAPPHFLEVYSTHNAFPASWQNWSIDVYGGQNSKTTYPLNNTNATACSTTGNKTWLTSNVPGGLRQQNALVILKDNLGQYVDAFVFDNQAPPRPWPGNPATDWFPELADPTLGCPVLATALTSQAANSGTTPNQANMLVLSNYGNRNMSRFPDGAAYWDITSNTGAGTTYTQCASNNANFSKVVDNSTPTPDSTVTFTLNLTNTGSSSLAGVLVSDFLPPVLSYLSATPSNPADPPVTTGTYATTDPNTGDPATATSVFWAPAAVAAGATSKLHIKMQVPAEAVVGYDYLNTAQTTAGLDPNQTDFVHITIGAINVPSFAISVSPAGATTCTPALLGPQVTITAMSAANGGGTPLTSYNGTATLLASSPNVQWHDAGGTLLAGNTVTLTNGVVTLYLTDSVAESVTVSAIDAATYHPNVMQGSSGIITFSGQALGLILEDADNLNPSYGAVTGRPHLVRATINNCGVTATEINGAYSGTSNYQPGINHPSGAGSPTINAAAASCPGSVSLPLHPGGAALSLTLTAGVTNFYLCTSDVGQYALNLTLNDIPTGQGNQTTNLTGATSNFTIRPFVITASGFTAGAISTPQGTLATDPKFISAGTTFSGVFDAWNWRAAEDLDNNGLPDSGIGTSAFSAATHQRPASFNGTVNQAGVINFAPQLAAPAGGVLGALSPSPGIVVANNGSATLNNLSYSEVGSITIAGPEPTPAYGAVNYLGRSGLQVPLLSEVIGRFIPDHFALSPDYPISGCTGFTYFGQNFSTPFTLTARNTAAAVTQNYHGDWSKLALADWSAFNFSANHQISAGQSNPAGSWEHGVATVVANHMPTRPDLPISPLELTVSAQPIDGDGVTMLAPAQVQLLSENLRYGRLTLANAFGSELDVLELGLGVEYFDNNKWLVNHDDNCSTYDAAALTCSDPELADALVCASVAASGNNVPAGGRFILAAPSPAAPGALHYELAAAEWLQGDWDGDDQYIDNPVAIATFGIYRGNRRIINWREIIR